VALLANSVAAWNQAVVAGHRLAKLIEQVLAD
jgi:hypothetical protein